MVGKSCGIKLVAGVNISTAKIESVNISVYLELHRTLKLHVYLGIIGRAFCSQSHSIANYNVFCKDYSAYLRMTAVTVWWLGG